jgi:RNA polymerase sigma-70 factor, ECF subfamily
MEVSVTLATLDSLPADDLAQPSPSIQAPAADPERLRAFVTGHLAFVYRSLRRLGLAEADAEDAAQQVMVVASQKLEQILPGREQAFLFSTAMNVASRVRRARGRRREIAADAVAEPSDPHPGPDEIIDHARARALLDHILDGMPMDLRAVFVLFEIEELSMRQIADALELAPGTVASRLRRAREHFQQERRRIEARRAFRGAQR